MSSSVSGMVGNRADRVKPQNFWGDMSFLVAVNFHPIWLAQILHWAIVQAYLRIKKGKSAQEMHLCIPPIRNLLDLLVAKF